MNAFIKFCYLSIYLFIYSLTSSKGHPQQAKTSLQTLSRVATKQKQTTDRARKSKAPTSQLVKTKPTYGLIHYRFSPLHPLAFFSTTPPSASHSPPFPPSNANPRGKAGDPLDYLSHLEQAKYMHKPYALVSGITKKRLQTIDGSKE